MNPDRETASRAVAVPLQQQHAHRCGKCGRDFVVIFETEADDVLERAPVACPHCWQIDHVMVAASARWGKNYRAERA